ncbi:MAG: cobalt-precorrin-4/precorrin-4 C(11)-methyltransferase, partial [Bilophila sp.]
MNSTVVQFIGAGPGAEDLITLRGAQALEQADVVVYAGSLVNPAHLRRCRPECETHDSATLHLEAQVDIMQRAALAGKRVVRLHTGDPAMYGAIAEQIKALAVGGVRSSIVPGVSSVFGAAASLGCELTLPGVSQSVVLTRTPGRTPMPSGESAAHFARTGATLVFFLSTGHLSTLTDELTGQGALAP